MNRIVITIFIAALLVGCNRNDNYIIPVDYEKLFESVSSQTEQQGSERTFQIMQAHWDNTVGKEVPDIKVKGTDGKSYKLKKLLKQGSIIIFSTPNCGWGEEEAETEFPALCHEISDELEGIDIFCLIENDKSYDQQKVSDYAWALQKEYSKVYLIEQKDAQRINLNASPTKLFINEEQTVVYMQLGYAMDHEAQINLIRAGINEINKEKL